MKLCQSCGMPLDQNKDLMGTTASGEKTDQYCIYCFENGNYTLECTMEEMIDICVPHILESMPLMNKEQAYDMMNQLLPELDRWKS